MPAKGSGVEPTKEVRTLTAAERVAVCRWSTDTQGGPGKAYTCGGANLTVDTVDGCVQRLAASASCTCTVAQIEARSSLVRAVQRIVVGPSVWVV